MHIRCIEHNDANEMVLLYKQQLWTLTKFGKMTHSEALGEHNVFLMIPKVDSSLYLIQFNAVFMQVVTKPLSSHCQRTTNQPHVRPKEGVGGMSTRPSAHG